MSIDDANKKKQNITIRMTRLMSVILLCFVMLTSACMSDVRKSGNEFERFNVSKGNVISSEKAIPMVELNGTKYISSKTLLEQMEFDYKFDERQKKVSFGYSDILFQVVADQSEAIEAEETVRLSKKPIWKDGQVWFPETMMNELFRDEVMYSIKHHHLILHPVREHPPVVADDSEQEQELQENRYSAKNDFPNTRSNHGMNDADLGEASPPSYGWDTIENPFVREGQSLPTRPELNRDGDRDEPTQQSPSERNYSSQSNNATKREHFGFQVKSTSSINMNQLIQFAKKYLGVKYEFGAEPYQKSGTFDCSSFVAHVYGRFGIDMPRSSRSQAKLGKTISRSQMKPGDLMFFSVPGRFSSDKVVGHVAIYIGDGKMIHSSPAPDNGVQITDIDRDHWKKTYLFSKRIE